MEKLETIYLRDYLVTKACLLTARVKYLGYDCFLELGENYGDLEIYYDSEKSGEQLQLILRNELHIYKNTMWIEKEVKYEGYTIRRHCLIEIY